MSDLPPLPEESFDGEKETQELVDMKCSHKNVTLSENKREVRCECNASWGGFGVHELYKELINQ